MPRRSFRRSLTNLTHGPVTLTQAGSAVASAGGATNPDPDITFTTFAPASAATGGNSVATLTGTGFVGPVTVTFGPNSSQTKAVKDSSTITCTIPASPASGATTITITQNTKSASRSDFTYFGVPTYTSVTPTSDVTVGGAVLTITGTQLVPSSTTVSIGGANATGVGVTAFSSLTCTTPSSAATGAVDIVISTPSGDVTATGAFTYADNGTTDPTTLLFADYFNVVFRNFNAKAANDGDRGTGSFPNKTTGSEGWDGVEWNQTALSIVDGTGVGGLSTPPLSSPNVLKTAFAQGLVGGVSPGTAQTQAFDGAAHGNLSLVKLGVLLCVAFDSTFEEGPSGLNKLMFLDLTHGFLGVSNGSFRFNLQGTPDNARGFLANNISTTHAVVTTDGRWHSVLLICEMNSPAGTANGIFKMYVYDHTAGGGFILCASYTDINWNNGAAPYFTQAQWTPVWGGVGGATSQAFNYYVDQVKVWGKQ